MVYGVFSFHNNAFETFFLGETFWTFEKKSKKTRKGTGHT